MRLDGLYDALHNRGRTLPAGSGATVGIAGLTLAGGLGILGRTHGLTCDQLLGAQIVLADGHTLDCDEHHESELFWALRGAGSGHFGVVTSLLLRTVEASPATAFHLTWSHRHAAAVAESWQHWAPRAPEELTASLLFTVPGAINEPPCVSLFGAMLGADLDTHALLQGFSGRVGGDPQTIHVAHGSHHDARRYPTALGDQFEELDRASSQPARLQQVGVLPPHASGRRPGSTASQPREGAPCRRDARARLQALGRGLQPAPDRCDRLSCRSSLTGRC